VTNSVWDKVYNTSTGALDGYAWSTGCSLWRNRVGRIGEQVTHIEHRPGIDLSSTIQTVGTQREAVFGCLDQELEQ